MTKSFRTLLVVSVSAMAVLSAGTVLTVQAFTATPTPAPVAEVTAGVTATTDAAAVTMTDWNETRIRASVIRP